jgi:hypothetical protein
VTGLNHEKFETSLKSLAAIVGENERSLKDARDRLQRVARAAHAAGMTERQIARAAGRSGPAVHAWLHAGDAVQESRIGT